MSFRSIRVQQSHDDRAAHVVLAAPPGNILDSIMMEELSSACDQLAANPRLRAVVLSGQGNHFSYGASVQEHLPAHMANQLERFRNLLLKWTALPAATVAAVQGRCLGGGLELVLACDLIVADATARLAFPEIRLASFPPAGTVLLPLRLGTGPAAQLLLTGEEWDASRAHSLGLVHHLAEDGDLAPRIQHWLEDALLSHSATAVRQAAKALRRSVRAALQNELPELERLYLKELLPHPDAEEGVRAFLEKRAPSWQE